MGSGTLFCMYNDLVLWCLLKDLNYRIYITSLLFLPSIFLLFTFLTSSLGINLISIMLIGAKVSGRSFLQNFMTNVRYSMLIFYGTIRDLTCLITLQVGEETRLISLFFASLLSYSS